MARILVIDDDPMIRFTVREVLQAAGHEVAEAGNGVEGVAHQAAAPCDLVITDIIMPRMEGIQTIVELRRVDPGLPILAISGGGRTHNLDFLNIADRFGADATLAKPFSDDQLLAAVDACLARAGRAPA